MKTQIKVSDETIKEIKYLSTIGEKLWITNGNKQYVLNEGSVLETKIKEPLNLSKRLLPDWSNEIGFGVLNGKDFVEALSQSGDPIIDFKNARKSQNITIPNNGNTRTLNIISPEEITGIEGAKSIKFKLPKMNLMILLSWDEIIELKKKCKKNKLVVIERSTKGNKGVSIGDDKQDGFRLKVDKKNVQPNDSLFRFSFHIDYLKLPKGDYRVGFSQEGISEWVNLTNKKYKVVMMIPESDCWFQQPKTLTQLERSFGKKGFEKFWSKDYRSVNQHSKRVLEAWRKGVDAIIETGRLLSIGKKKFFEKHSRSKLLWESFLETLPFGLRTVERLIFIYENREVLLDKKVYPNLPPNWRTLYELLTIGHKKDLLPEVNLTKKDFVVKALEDDEGIPILRGDTTRKEIEDYKKEMEVEYFEVPSREPEIKPHQFIITGEPNTPQSEITKMEVAITKLLQDNEWFSLNGSVFTPQPVSKSLFDNLPRVKDGKTKIEV